MPDYFIAYKPFNVLTQFSDTQQRETLQVLKHDFPKDVYPVGRLDRDSEGLLFLTNNVRVNHQLLNPRFKHEREYWVQVEGEPTPESLLQLQQGLQLKDHLTLPCQAEIMASPDLPPRDPPVRFRQAIPTTWLKMVLHEGKNRQVRRMTAAVGFPTLRLVRVRIENLWLGSLLPGEVRSLTAEERQLFIQRLF